MGHGDMAKSGAEYDETVNQALDSHSIDAEEKQEYQQGDKSAALKLDQAGLPLIPQPSDDPGDVGGSIISRNMLD